VLEEFSYEDFAQPEITRLTEMRLGALEDRIDADLRTGQSRGLVGELEVLVRDNPYRERLAGQLMLALYRVGSHGQALRAFERYRRTIGEEVGIEPSPELCRLEEQILLHDPRLRGPAEIGEADERLPNPFKGLRAFRESDAERFFGRDRLVAETARCLRRERLVALVGPSGSGKSSVVRAGLIPALRRGAVPGSDDWLIAEMVPGSRPFDELEVALSRSTPEPPGGLSEQLQDGRTGVLRAGLRLLPDNESHLLIVIDQFEELFTLVEDEETRTRFVDGLEAAVRDTHRRISLVITLRADFYEHTFRYPEFGSRLGAGVVNVVPMLPDELEEAAVAPARCSDAFLEPALLATLVTDVVGRPGALPLFQYTLTELFDRRVNGFLTLDSYQAIGGIAGGLTNRAEEVFGSLDVSEQEAARQLLLRMVTIAEGDEWVRRRVAASEVLALPGDVVDLHSVVDEFSRNRLLTLDRDRVSGAPTLEVAHEALLSGWGRLRSWIHDAKADLRKRATLLAAVDEWEGVADDTGYLLTGARLDAHEAWARSTDIALTPRETAFLQRSIDVRDRVVDEERDRELREARLARRASVRLWGLAAAVAVLFLSGVISSDPPKVGMIYEGRGDQGLNDLTALGLEEANRIRDIDTAVVVPFADSGEDLTKLCQTGHELVILAGLFVLPESDASPACADTLIVGMDFPPPGVIPELDQLLDQLDLVSAVFATEESAYLAGSAAALTTDTGVVGFVGGMRIPPVDLPRAGFEAGARAIDPDIEIVSVYLSVDSEVEAFADEARAQRATELVIESGADVVFHATVGGAGGVLRAVREASVSTGVHRWYVGAGVDDYVSAPRAERPHVLTSVIQRADTVVLDVIDDYLAGTLAPGVRVYDLSNGGVDLSESSGQLDDLADQLNVIRADIAAGRISVPTEVGPATLAIP
jgi:basic membrane lipoprotein Med (substrate-binding protein (PBP1-ABC) superfamily)